MEIQRADEAINTRGPVEAHVILSDLILAASYFVISATVLWLHNRLYIHLRLPHQARLERLGTTLAVLITGFIMTCGMTHFLKAAANLVDLHSLGDVLAGRLAILAGLVQVIAAIGSAAAAAFLTYNAHDFELIGAHMEVHPRGAVDASVKAVQIARAEERKELEISLAASKAELARLRRIEQALTGTLGQQLQELGRVAQGVREASFLREFRAISAQVADASATVVRHVAEQKGTMDNAVAAGLKVAELRNAVENLMHVPPFSQLRPLRIAGLYGLLSSDLACHILEFLNVAELNRIACVCRTFTELKAIVVLGNSRLALRYAAAAQPRFASAPQGLLPPPSRRDRARGTLAAECGGRFTAQTHAATLARPCEAASASGAGSSSEVAPPPIGSSVVYDGHGLARVAPQSV